MQYKAYEKLVICPCEKRGWAAIAEVLAALMVILVALAVIGCADREVAKELAPAASDKITCHTTETGLAVCEKEVTYGL